MEYLKRNIDNELLEWTKSADRMPLLIRGARQIGKTSSIRNIGKIFKYYVELDLNYHQEMHELFSKDISPQEICRQISFIMNIPIIEGETLLFIDEIQSCPAAISRLRYFYERYPALHLIAAGSLLEFALEDLTSFGVGRIRSVFMYPFSFEEFLIANNESLAVEAFRNASPEKPLMEAVHNKLVNRFQTFLLLGGMPKIVSEYVKSKDLLKCQQFLNDLSVSYQDDFAKYNKRVPTSRITDVFNAVAHQSQGKFVYSAVNSDSNIVQVKQALELLIKAGLVYPVVHTSANGVPLGAEVNERYRRMVLFDTGLLQRILNLNLRDLFTSTDMKVVNKGALAEIFVATELVKATSCYEHSQLFCWHRERKDSQAEIDFVVQSETEILPIEVKSGKSGSMQSLRIFMKSKSSRIGIRTSLENFSKYEDVEVYPLYAISNLLRKE